MARHPDWFGRLDTIFSVVQKTPIEWLGRREIKAIFSCSERDSIRLLHRFGATENNDALCLSTPSLMSQLEAVRAGLPYAAFLRQRQRVAQTLTVAQAENVARQRRIDGSVDFRYDRSISDLPANIRLEPGRVTFAFTYPDEFWALVNELANIAAQDVESFEAATLAKNPL